ncbi:MAG: hypothetical protein EXS10_01690 [Phycisphaerales bacterium]|nr:hypothetical protein [Phycisphaerales bacterium]
MVDIRELASTAIAYSIPCVNDGEVITHYEAEVFGATLLSMSREAYDHALCEFTNDVDRARL